MDSDSRARKKPAAERHALPALQPRSRAMRARILAAAEQVFAESGYDGARLADIAERAGCSVGAVYFRFKDKNALFLAIAETFAEEARAGNRLSAASGDDWGPIVRRFVADTAENFRRHKGLFRAIVERGLDHPNAMGTIFVLREEFANALEATLRTFSSDCHGPPGAGQPVETGTQPKDRTKIRAQSSRSMPDHLGGPHLRAMTSKVGDRDLSLQVRVMTQMVYGFLLTGVLNPKAPTKINDIKAVNELADACVAYLRACETGEIHS